MSNAADILREQHKRLLVDRTNWRAGVESESLHADMEHPNGSKASMVVRWDRTGWSWTVNCDDHIKGASGAPDRITAIRACLDHAIGILTELNDPAHTE